MVKMWVNDIQKELKEMVVIPDNIFYHRLLNDYPGSEHLNSNQAETIVAGCMREAERVLIQLKSQYGCLSAVEYAKILGISVKWSIEPLVTGEIWMGSYHPQTRMISVNQKLIFSLQKYMEELRINEIISIYQLSDIVIFHEIFHALEEMTPGIFTRCQWITQKFLGIIPYRIPLDGASEVGAVHFSKCMAALEFSPCVYEEILKYMERETLLQKN